MRVSLTRLLLAGLMAATALTAAQATAAHASTATAACGPTYGSRTASSSAPWPGSSIPWRSVGQGWILGAVTAKQSGTGPQTLYLVSPGGQRYRVGTAPSGAMLVDWSGASMDALFVTQPVSGPKAMVYVLNLKTGRTNGFSVYSAGGDFISLSFIRPSGQGILVLASATSTGGFLPVQRYSLTGTRQACYPDSFPGTGGGADGYAESPSGAGLLLELRNGGFEILSNSGRPVRSLRPPPGFTSCGTLNWWSGTVVVASCASASQTTAELWAFPLSGARPTQISGKGQSAIFMGAWRLPSGTFAREAACGSSWLERLNSNGTGTRVLIPGATNAGSVEPLGTYGNRMPVLTTGGCDGHTPYSKVDWFSPASNTATTVLGASAGGGFVIDALLYPEI